MLSYVNDNEIKIDYSETNKKVAFPLNVIGASAGVDIDEADYTYVDANTIFVDKTGDDGDAGTQAAPKLTILAGINACTVSKTKVVVLDSNRYDEDVSGYSNSYFAGLFSATGETAVLNQRSLSYTPDNDNSIFVDKDGDDGDAGTTAEPKLTIAGAIAACDATHQAVVIQDSGTYEESYFEFTGNFLGLYGQIGCNPTVKITTPDYVSDKLALSSLTTLDSIEADADDEIKIGVFSNNDFICAWTDDTENKLYFKLFNSDFAALTEKVELDSTCFNMDICILSDDRFVITWIDSDQTSLFGIIYNKDMTIDTEEETLWTAPGGLYVFDDVAVDSWASSDRIIVAFKETVETLGADMGNVGFLLLDDSLTLIDDEVGSGSGSTYLTGIDVVCILDDVSSPPYIGAGDYFAVVYRYTDNQIHVGTSRSAIILGSRFIDGVGGDIVYNSSNTYSCPSIAGFSNGDFVIVTCEVETGDYLFAIYDYECDPVVDGTYEGDGIIANANNRVARVAVDSDDNFLCSGIRNFSGQYYLQYYVHSQDGSQVLTTDELINIGCVCCDIKLFSNNNFIIGFNDDSPDNYYFRSYMPFYKRGLIVSSDCTIEGITFNGDTIEDWAYFIQATAEITMINCTMTDIYFPHYNAVGFDAIGFQIKSTDDIDIDKCIFKDSYGGVYVFANNTTADDCIFSNIVGGFGLVFGANYDEMWTSHIEHCSFNVCNGGIYWGRRNLSNPYWIKNCCFSQISRYSVFSATYIELTYCVIPDELWPTVFRGDGCLKMNPLYIDNGEVNEGNLNLKNKLIGYPVNSPAFNNSDDDRDCGAYDVNYVGDVPTWTSITIPKENISPKLTPAGAVKTINKDGSIGSTIKGWTEEITFQWPTMTISDFNNILSLLTSNISKIRIYLEPTTNANDFVLYNIIYDSLNMGVEVYTASGTVRQNVSLTVGRGYEYSS